MPVFVGRHPDIICQVDVGNESWVDFTEQEIYALERTWGNDAEIIHMVQWPNHSFYMPVNMGGISWLQGLGPFQVNNNTGRWRRMRRLLKISE